MVPNSGAIRVNSIVNLECPLIVFSLYERNSKLETLAQTCFTAWFIATAFGYKYYCSISIIHVSRTRAGLKLDKNAFYLLIQ